MCLFPLLYAAKLRGSIPHGSIFFNTKSDGQALRVSLVKLVAYLSSSYMSVLNFAQKMLVNYYWKKQ